MMVIFLHERKLIIITQDMIISKSNFYTKSTFRFEEECLWIVKPPNLNNGTGIKVISNSIINIPNYETCVQKYVKNPLLINGYKVGLKSIQT